MNFKAQSCSQVTQLPSTTSTRPNPAGGGTIVNSTTPLNIESPIVVNVTIKQSDLQKPGKPSPPPLSALVSRVSKRASSRFSDAAQMAEDFSDAARNSSGLFNKIKIGSD